MTSPNPLSTFTEGAIGPAVLAFASPILGAITLQTMNGSINAMWIGRYLGEAALTGSTNANLIISLVIGIAYGVSTAGSILIARSLGGRHVERARRVVGTGVTFFAALSLLISLVGYCTTPWMMDFLATPSAAIPYGESYLRVVFMTMPVMLFFSFISSTLRGSGDSKSPLIFMGLAVLLDIVLNPPLIFGWGRLPALGIAGSALATMIAQLIALGAMLFLLYRRKHFLRITYGERSLLRPDLEILGSLTLKGTPIGLQMLVMSGSATIMLRIINAYGPSTVAAYSAASQLWNYMQLPAVALAGAISTISAQNIGAGSWRRVDQALTVGLVFHVISMAAIFLLIRLGGHMLLRLFLPDDPATVALAIHLNDIVIWAFIFVGLAVIPLSVIRANGSVWPPLIIQFVALWLVRPLFAMAMQERWGADAIWWSSPLCWFATMTLTIGYYKWGSWRQATMLPSITIQ